MTIIRVHDWDQVAAALTAARELARTPTLLSPPATQAGIGWWRELVCLARQEFPEVAFTALLDCGPSSGLALAALHNGAGPVAVKVDAVVLEKLADIARQVGTFATEGGKPALDLAGMSDPSRACRDVLRAEGATPTA